MPSVSPVSSNRPKLQARSNTTADVSGGSSSQSSLLSPTSKSQAGDTQHVSRLKVARPHLVSRHSKNVSHGHVIGHGHGSHANLVARAIHPNMPPKKALAQVYGDATRHHRRAKSGTNTPSASPRGSTAGGHMKRNSSHVVLPKNRSHGNLNLRKNQSTNTLTALNRNVSRGALNKLGAPADQKSKEAAQQKQSVFNLGDDSDEEEEEGEWEDSTASPELTRNNTRNNSASNSKAHTPSRPQTPVEESALKPPDPDPTLLTQRTSSPPEPDQLKANRSAPNLRIDLERARSDPTWLVKDGRGSRAPPAMTTANARPSQQHLDTNTSQRSVIASQVSLQGPDGQKRSPATFKSDTTLVAGDSPGSSAPVSHFLTSETPRDYGRRERALDLSDDEDSNSVSDFLSTYKPQISESPEKPRTVLNRARLPTQPSRTQQRLELQRSQQMRGSGTPTSTSSGLAMSIGSSVTVHSRSTSKGRNRHLADGDKAIRTEYENAMKQLTVVRRFRNPVIESLNRYKQNQSTALESGTQSPNKQDQRRPPSRRGHASIASSSRPASTVETTPAATPPENHKSVSFGIPENRGQRDSKVTFQLARQDSHEEILKPVHSLSDTHSAELHHDDDALIRRMWDSRIHVA